ncbi:hypothetical protein PV325_012931, partial [Microctonus aethiopoides]
AVCTYNLSFTSVLAGYAGCVHDARVFRLSRVQEYIDNPAVFKQISISVYHQQECRLSELLGYGKAVGKHDYLETERILRISTRQQLTNNAKAEGDAKRIRIMRRLPMRAI